MALLDDKPRILDALAAIPGVKAALPAWPKADARMPCVVATLAANEPEDTYDDHEYLTALEYYIRVFTNYAQDRAEIAAHADKAMTALGYRRVFMWEDDGADTRQTVMRYRRICAADDD
jgi:hypothetical protein